MRYDKKWIKYLHDFKGIWTSYYYKKTRVDLVYKQIDVLGDMIFLSQKQ